MKNRIFRVITVALIAVGMAIILVCALAIGAGIAFMSYEF